MNKQGNAFKYFVIFVLALVAVMQIKLKMKNSKISKRLASLESQIQMPILSDSEVTSSNETTYKKKWPGDQGDWLVWALQVEPKTLNSISTEADIYQRWICFHNIFEPLLKYDYDELALKPFLAKSYSISEDGLKISYTLRDDICFSDGHPITSDDVIFTYNTITNPKIDAASLANMFLDVERAEKVSDKEVVFYMQRPYMKALESTGFWDIGILPEHIYKYDDPFDFNKRVSDPVGSGPYVFEKWKKGQFITLVRNDNYWGKLPNIQKLVFQFIQNDSAIVQALKAGQVDMFRPAPDQFYDLSQNEEFSDKFRLISYWNPAVPFYYIGWNQSNPLFKDKETRLALTLLTDREKIVKSLLKGNAEVISGPFYHKGSQYDKSIKPWPYDPARAKQILSDAGWADSDNDGILERDGRKFSFTFKYASSLELYKRLAVYLKDSYSAAGIELIPTPVEWSVLITDVTDRKFEAIVLGWGGDIMSDPYQLWHSSQIDNKGSNYVGLNSQIADDIIDEIRVSIDQDKRDRLFYELHELIHEQQPYTFLYAVPEFRIIDKRFENVKVHALGLNYLEWYVPKDKQKYK